MIGDQTTNPDALAKAELNAQAVMMRNGNNDRMVQTDRNRRTTIDPVAVAATRAAHEHMAATFESEARQRQADELHRKYTEDREAAHQRGDVDEMLRLDEAYTRASRKLVGDSDLKPVGSDVDDLA